MTVPDNILRNLRKKEGENDDEFVERMKKKGYDMTSEDLARWKEITKDGTSYGGPSDRHVI